MRDTEWFVPNTCRTKQKIDRRHRLEGTGRSEIRFDRPFHISNAMPSSSSTRSIITSSTEYRSVTLGHTAYDCSTDDRQSWLLFNPYPIQTRWILTRCSTRCHRTVTRKCLKKVYVFSRLHGSIRITLGHRVAQWIHLSICDMIRSNMVQPRLKRRKITINRDIYCDQAVPRVSWCTSGWLLAFPLTNSLSQYSLSPLFMMLETTGEPNGLIPYWPKSVVSRIFLTMWAQDDRRPTTRSF